ncbi:remorin 4.1-like isoform X2 [Tasmannia lanceolata]|uniref:remorin 4.1-like isoform X2 n=1 Tax=Tasmannia lanceolata TaxID=3420 RepID=UPI004062FE06
MLQDQGGSNGEEESNDNEIRDIHQVNSPANQGRRREAWETSSLRSPNLSLSSEIPSEIFTTMSREFNALVLAGSSIEDGNNDGSNLARIGEEDHEETNPLAIVPDNGRFDPVPSPRPLVGSSGNSIVEEVSLQMVKKEETQSKISAWQTAKIAKINNRFKREDAIINGWEGEHVQKATTWMKKVESKQKPIKDFPLSRGS